MRISGNPTWLLLSLGAFLVACPGDDKDDTEDPIVEDDTAEDTDGTDQEGDGNNSDTIMAHIDKLVKLESNKKATLQMISKLIKLTKEKHS